MVVVEHLPIESTDFHQAPKNLPPAAKTAKILTWFQESMGVYSFKELEKILPAVASINGMQVKEYLQSLQDEHLIRTEKIGSGNWYWCFLSDAKKQKENTLNSLKADEEKLRSGIEEAHNAYEAEKNARAKEDEMVEDGGVDRDALMIVYEELLKEKESLDAGLACYSENDPVAVAEKIEETKRLKDSAIRWTDNIEAVEYYIGRLVNDRAQTADMMARCCGDEYVAGEGLKELV